ncbi:MAG: type II secretion system F family protein [Patescibacteria group bacterium]|nr:type II secretion system F family protein [Patescibacteria group bacterium]
MFHFVATTKEGQMYKGMSELPTREAVIRELESAGYVVVSVSRTRSGSLIDDILARFGGIGHLEIVLFTKHLSLMIRAGLTLSESLRILQEQATSLRFRVILKRMVKQLEGGGSFSEALGSYPKIFSRFYVNIVRAGEISGTLEQNLDHLAEQYTKEHELRAKVRTALMYPTIVLVAALSIGFFFAAYVLPQVAQLFTGLKGIHLPAVTVFILWLAAFAKKYTLASALTLVVVAVFAIWFLRRNFLRPATHWMILKLPVIGGISRDVNLARFSLVFGTLLRSGIPITRALEVTADVLDNYYYKKAVLTSFDEVQSGEALSTGLAKAPNVFPTIVTRMVNVGERSGKLEDVLGYLADFYQLEVDTIMRNLSDILEPILLVGIGIVAMVLAYAIIIPIYDFIGTIARIAR